MRPSPGSAVLSRGLVTSLDLVRGAAAVYVAVHHIVVARGWGTGLGFAFRFGEEAVIVFFLLSGFVIFANEADRIHDWASYYLRRFLRIYPPFLAALLVSASRYWMARSRECSIGAIWRGICSTFRTNLFRNPG
jgi:peptidoglycan/LPS O-acetylase OafA/YrhL